MAAKAKDLLFFEREVLGDGVYPDPGFVTIHGVTNCCICGEPANAHLTVEELHKEKKRSLAQMAASDIYKMGWRTGTSRKFGVTGPMCPDCKGTKDHLREN
jgi:hypothetical protein